MLSWSARNFRFPWQFPSLNTTFPNLQLKCSAFLQCFRCYSCFFSCCIVTEVAKENLLKTPAIVPLANFQRVQILRHPRLALDWLSVSFFDYLPIKMSVLLLLCTELTFFCTELPKHCIYLSQSELINFFMYITSLITINWRRFINMFPDFMVYCFYGIVFLLWHCLYLQRLLNRFPCYGGGVISKNTKNASKKERVHGLHILLYALCLAFFRQRLSLSKKIASRRCYECTCNGCWFVFLRKRDFQPWSVVAFNECKRVWYDTPFFLYFIHSISVILWYDLPVEKKLCLVLELYFR